MIKEYSLQEIRKEIHEYLSSALHEASNNALTLQEFFDPTDAPLILESITAGMYRIIDSSEPDIQAIVSFRQSTSEELAAFKSKTQQTMLNTIMQHFAHAHESLTGGN